jgi:hypothetical protein
MTVINLLEYLLHRDILISIGREVEFLRDVPAEGEFWNFGYPCIQRRCPDQWLR